MNIKSGFNRIFILLALIISIFSGIIAYHEGIIWEPKTKTRDVFTSFKWSENRIQQYYKTAEYETKNVPESFIRSGLDVGPSGIIPQELPNFKKNPPQFNEFIFKKAFPQAHKIPTHVKILDVIISSILFFFISYGVLHLIMFTTFWIIDGFSKKGPPFLQE